MLLCDLAQQDQIFNLKFTAKQLSRSAIKAEKEEKSEKLKVRGHVPSLISHVRRHCMHFQLVALGQSSMDSIVYCMCASKCSTYGAVALCAMHSYAHTAQVLAYACARLLCSDTGSACAYTLVVSDVQDPVKQSAYPNTSPASACTGS